MYNWLVVTLLPTKFYLPPAPTGFVERPQLLETLNKTLTHRLTLISAPAGAGKTTLVSDWANSVHKRGIVIGWLSLDEADNDLPRFMKYLMACLEEGGLLVDSAVSTPIPGEQVQLDNTLADFIQGIVPLKRETVLILDDYHLIQSKQVHELVECLIERGPSHLHLMILTRSDPPLELARLRVAGQLVEVRMEHLRFSTSEAAAFLKSSAEIQLADSDVAALNERAEGWIAGLQMAAISMRGRKDLAAFIAAFGGSHRFVFDYLLEQVMDRQAPEVREFLLKTSVLDQLCTSLCEAVAETGGNARGMLDILERTNLFLIPLDDERGWYRYHRLFSDLLGLMLEQTCPGLSVELHRRACLWYEAQEMLSEALDHALSTGDMQLVAHIVSANVLVLVENDEAEPTLRKIDSVPQDKFMATPWLGLARAWAMGIGQVQKTHEILDEIERSAAEEPEDLEQRRLKGHLAAARAFVFSVQGDIPNTISNAKSADELLPEDEIAIRALNLANWGDVLSADRHDPGAMPILDRAWTLALQAKKPHVAMIAAGALASAHLGAGRLHEVQRICLEALDVAESYQKKYQRLLSATSNVYSLLARTFAEWGENEKAIEYAHKGVMLSERWGIVDTDVICLDYLGRALVFANDWDRARQVFQRAQSAAPKVSPWFWQMTANFVLDSMLDSDAPSEQEINEQIRCVEASGGHYPNILKARLLLRDCRSDEALAVLEQALEEFKGRPSMDILRIHCLRALAFHAGGYEKQAHAALKQALELAEPENRIATFVREGPKMEKLLQLARSRLPVSKFVQRLLAAFESRHKQRPVPAPMAEALIEPLSERELEILHYLNGPLSTPEIAEQLVVSANTVRTHIKNIYGKLGVHGRSAAIQRVRTLGLLG